MGFWDFDALMEDKQIIKKKAWSQNDSLDQSQCGFTQTPADVEVEREKIGLICVLIAINGTCAAWVTKSGRKRPIVVGDS